MLIISLICLKHLIDKMNNFFLIVNSSFTRLLYVNFMYIAFCRSNEDRASYHNKSGSYLSNLNGPTCRAKDGGNTKQGINREGFAR